LKIHLRLVEDENRSRASSTAGLTVSALPETESCPRCAGPTFLLKSAKRNVVTLAHGAFVAREVIRACSSDCREPSGQRTLQRSQLLASQVAPGAVYGYDLEVHVGRERFLHNRQREEIRQGLLENNRISLSSGQVSLLAARFIEHLEALHWKRAPQLAQAMHKDGGYAMHIDATGEDGRGTTLVVYNGWRGWALGAWKISTERSDLVLPRLRQIAKAFGPPSAIMRDLGRAMIEAARQLVRETKLKIPILGCHSHFLRDVGKDLMEVSYDQIRRLVRRHCLRARLRTLARNLGRKLSAHLPGLREDVETWARAATDRVLPTGAAGLAIVRSLAQWPLDYKRDGHSMGFPFDRPHLDFYRRCYTVRRAADAFLRQAPGDKQVRRALTSLVRALDPVINDKNFCDAVAKLVRRAALFERLRQVLRLCPGKKQKTGAVLSARQAAAVLRDVRDAVRRFQQRLRSSRPKRGPAQDTRQAIDVVLDHLKRHGRSLWGHAIRLPGGGIRLVDRTNNVLEGFFRGLKHGERRRSGRKVLTYDFERLPAAAVLAANLTRPDYVEILCGSLDLLPLAFMEIDVDQRAMFCSRSKSEGRDAANEILSSSLPHADLALIRASALRDCIFAAAQSRAPHVVLDA
jgi:hypothetical protein